MFHVVPVSVCSRTRLVWTWQIVMVVYGLDRRFPTISAGTLQAYDAYSSVQKERTKTLESVVNTTWGMTKVQIASIVLPLQGSIITSYYRFQSVDSSNIED